MSERYTKLFSLHDALYLESAPVVIQAGALLRDNVTQKVLAQLKLQNISPIGIKAVTVQIVPQDTAGRELGGPVTYQYLDLHVERDGEFGEQTPIGLPDAAARSFRVCVTEAVFTDNNIWSASAAKWTPFPKPQPLTSVLNEELLKQYWLENGQNCKVKPQQFRDLWYCTCGACNRNTETNCHACHRPQSQCQQMIDAQKLREHADARIAKEKEEAAARIAKEQEEAAARKAAVAEKHAAAAKKIRKIAVAIAAVVVIGVVVKTVVIPRVQLQQQYKDAVALYEAGKTEKAAIAFGELGEYQDANERSRALWKKFSDVSLDANGVNTIGLKSDGTAIAVGNNEYGQCNVSEWKDIIAIAAGGCHMVGLKSDGTVVAAGDNEDGQCNVSEWKDIVALFAGGSNTVGLKPDGTVVAVGNNGFGQCNMENWEDIIEISGGTSHTVGLKSDGTVVAVGDNEDGQCDVSDWKDIIAISAGEYYTVGLKSDGTVVAVGSNKHGQCDVSDWKDIVAISAGGLHTVGLKSDRTVVAAGYNFYGECNVKKWEDIIGISAGTFHTVGLKSDGTVVAVGDNEYGQCDVSDWTDIKVSP